jgi:hypothetical protein
VKDSGKRESFDSGMVRDTTEGKIDYALALDGPMFKRYATHLTKGAEKYEKRNWMRARGQAELERFKESALRHFLQWLAGDVDEDHAAAVIFNINGAEYVKEQQEPETLDWPNPDDGDYDLDGPCDDCGPEGWFCERPPGHTGPHCFPYKHYGATITATSWT